MSALEDTTTNQGSLPAGQRLRKERERYGQSLDDIERALKIRAGVIEALEKSDFEHLPGRVYALGFVRSYAEYLGLDPDKMVETYRSEFETYQSAPELHFPVAASDSKIPSAWVVCLALVMCIGILYVWWEQKPDNRLFVERIPNVEQELGVDVVLNDEGEFEKIVERAPEELDVIESVTEATDIILSMIGSSWVEIKDKQGNTVVTRVLDKGDRYFVPNRPDLTISLGNAGAVVFEVGGRELGVLDKPGVAIRDVPVDAKLLIRKFRSQNLQSGALN